MRNIPLNKWSSFSICSLCLKILACFHFHQLFSRHPDLALKSWHKKIIKLGSLFVGLSRLISGGDAVLIEPLWFEEGGERKASDQEAPALHQHASRYVRPTWWPNGDFAKLSIQSGILSKWLKSTEEGGYSTWFQSYRTNYCVSALCFFFFFSFPQPCPPNLFFPPPHTHQVLWPVRVTALLCVSMLSSVSGHCATSPYLPPHFILSLPLCLVVPAGPLAYFFFWCAWFQSPFIVPLDMHKWGFTYFLVWRLREKRREEGNDSTLGVRQELSVYFMFSVNGTVVASALPYWVVSPATAL